MSIESISTTPLKAIIYPRTNPNVVKAVDELVTNVKGIQPPLIIYRNSGGVNGPDSIYITQAGSKLPGFADQFLQRLQQAGLDLKKCLLCFDPSLTDEGFKNLRNTGVGKFVG